MKRIAHARLIKTVPKRFTCLVELVSLATGTPSDTDGGTAGYVVNVRQGPPDGAQRESSLASAPLTHADALARANAFIQAKVAQSWQVTEIEGEGLVGGNPSASLTATLSPTNASSPTPPEPPSIKALRARFSEDKWKLLSPMRKSRSAWRVGELTGGAHDPALRTLVPRLVALLETGNDMFDYCLAFAIGRLGDTGACEAVQQLHLRGRTDATRRMAWLAQIALGGKPKEVALGEATAEQAYDLAITSAPNHIAARTKVMESAAALPLAYGTFGTLRHLLKAAEFRHDGALLGALHARFENTPAKRPPPHYGRKKDAPPHAYSPVTRHYLRTRAWRQLRRFAALEHPQFAQLAVSLLLGLRDTDLPSALVEHHSRYESNRWTTVEQHFPPASRWLLVRKLLLAKHPDVRGSERATRWWSTKPIDSIALPAARWEAFQPLWDQHPQALLRLCLESQAALVHGMAARALQDNRAFLGTLQDGTAAQLLQSAYATTAQLGFDAVRVKIESDAPIEAKAAWLTLLVRSRLSAAHTYAQNWISLDLNGYAKHAALMVALLCAPTAALRGLGQGMAALSATQPHTAANIMLGLIEWLEAADHTVADLPACLGNIRAAVEGGLAQPAADAPAERLAALLLHHEISVAVVAHHWLQRCPRAMDAISTTLLTALMRSEEPDRQAIGIAWFVNLPDNLLRDQAGLLARYALSPHAKVREAARAAVKHLCDLDSAFARDFTQQVANTLFRTESGEGQHRDAMQWLQHELAPHTAQFDANYCWRATQAQSRGAQRLGAWLLGKFPGGQWSLRQHAVLTKNNEQSVRAASLTYLGLLPTVQLSEQAGELLPLFDSTFDEVLEFAQHLLGTQLKTADLPPSFLVALIDHPKAWVQALGRETLGRDMDAGHAVDYLLKLSQHPSHDVQLFVTNWLTRAQGANPAETAAQLEKLKPYFVAVLSHVNRARVAKNRVLAYLRGLTIAPETARVVADIFSRQVVTANLTDKPHIIAGLRDIAARHPSLPMPFVVPVATPSQHPQGIAR
jgi:cellulose synthase operon protein C